MRVGEISEVVSVLSLMEEIFTQPISRRYSWH